MNDKKMKRVRLNLNYHYVGNIESYYMDHSIPLWVRALTYLVIFIVEGNNRIFMSNEYLVNKFDSNLATVKYTMKVIKKFEFAKYVTTTNKGLKGKRRNVYLNLNKIEKCIKNMNWNSEELTTYEKKFSRYRVFSKIIKVTKEVSMGIYHRYLRKQSNNRQMQKHIGYYIDKVSVSFLDEVCKYVNRCKRIDRLVVEFRNYPKSHLNLIFSSIKSLIKKDAIIKEYPNIAF